MKIVLLFFLFLPFCSWSQIVRPVISPDYLDLINRDSSAKTKVPADTSNSIRSSPVTIGVYLNSLNPEKMSIRGNKLISKPHQERILLISGSFNTHAETKIANRVPELQNQFVQGSSQNGNLVWQGAETNEPFSYGPDFNTLEFNGAAYDYDRNGRLVARGTGNGNPSTAYNNEILQNVFLVSNSLSIQARYRRKSSEFLSTAFSLGRANENTVIPNSRISSKHGSASASLFTSIGQVTGSFQSQSNEISNYNRNGFLNRVYQNALLTPISFSNDQGYELAGGQRRFSNNIDNPHFLLQNDLNRFYRRRNIVAIGISNNNSRIRYRLVQTFEHLEQKNTEGYQPGTAFFEGGMLTSRDKYDKNFCLLANLSYDVNIPVQRVSSVASVNYVSSFNRSGINYFHGKHYSYRRNASDLAFNLTSRYIGYKSEAGAVLENKVYTSSTTLNKDFFLPYLSGYFRVYKLFGTNISSKFIAALSHFNSELPLGQSFAQASLLQYSTQNAFQYQPIKEAESFEELRPIRHREISIRTELDYKYNLRLNAEIFQRRISNDVFPFNFNNYIFLQNMATHRNSGFELELNWRNKNQKVLEYNTSLSFTSYKSKVIEVEENYDNIAIAGFSNIHKTIVKGQPLGMIRGKAFLRDGNQNIVIGNDGFPLADTVPKLIGNPHPDFVMKFWNSLSRKNIYFNISWEWKKGGEVWNGTAAVLDYYGRSKSTADLRNTTGIFQGVTTSGNVNTTPVAFYDPSLPVTKNRWTRNGYGGIDEEYVQKADYIRINNVSVSYKIISRKYIQSILLSASVNNILVWTPYEGGDPSQLLYDQADSAGLDFFNLPSLKQIGFSATIQF